MASPARNVDRLLERYGEFHRNRTNKAIHWVCVPLIVWSVLGALWSASPVAAYVAKEISAGTAARIHAGSGGRTEPN